MNRYLEFEEIKTDNPNRRNFEVKSDWGRLGFIEHSSFYDNYWDEYIFMPNRSLIGLDSKSLKRISTFLDKLNKDK